MDVLTNKSYKRYNNLSRYSVAPHYYHTVDNRHLVGFSEYLNDQTPYVLHIVKKHDTLDSMALYYYNNPTYYWIIADYNKILNPFEDLKEGSAIKIPSFSAISFDK